jgi:F1F0 ATPase subunit 2
MTMLAATLFLSLGFLAGALFFALLRWNVSVYMRGGSAAFALTLQVVRIAAAGGLLVVTALHGTLPLLLTALGLLIARPVVLHYMARGEA